MQEDTIFQGQQLVKAAQLFVKLGAQQLLFPLFVLPSQTCGRGFKLNLFFFLVGSGPEPGL